MVFQRRLLLSAALSLSLFAALVQGAGSKDWTVLKNVVGAPTIWRVATCDSMTYATTNGGLVFFNTIAQTVKTYTSSYLGDTMHLGYLSARPPVMVDAKKTLWVGGASGVIKYDTAFHFYAPTTFTLSAVTCLAMDSSGVLWVGTDGYLASFDGKAWTQYTQTQVSSATALAAGANTLWIGTSSGMSSYSGGTFTALPNPIPNGLPAYSVGGITIDKNGKVYVADYGSGLAVYDGATWTTYKGAQMGLAVGTAIKDVAVGPGGKVYVATDKGLAVYNGTSWSVLTQANSHVPYEVINSLQFDAAGRLWAASSYQGLGCFDGATWSVYAFELPGVAYGVATDKSGTAWLSIGLGTSPACVASYSRRDKNGVWRLYYPAQDSFPNLYISSILFDKQDHLWALCDTGLGMLDGTSWTNVRRGKNGLPATAVFKTLVFAPDNTPWLATNAGLFKRVAGTWTLAYDPTTAPSGFHPTASVGSLAIADNGTVWAYNGALIKSTASGWTHFNPSAMALYGSPSAMFTDAENTVWIGSAYGLLRIKNDSALTFGSTTPGLATGSVSSIARDSHNHLWLTNDQICFYDGAAFKTFTSDSTGATFTTQKAVGVDRYNCVWVVGKTVAIFTRDSTGTKAAPFLARSKGAPVRVAVRGENAYLSYSMKQPGTVAYSVFNLRGACLLNHFARREQAGSHHLAFSLAALPSGTVVLRFTAGDQNFTRTLSLQR